jgi:hypothetical protein
MAPTKKITGMKSAGSTDTRQRRRAGALDYALEYAKQGIRVIWIPRGSKAPVEKSWPTLATTDPTVIRQWAKLHSNCNFGLVMGSGFVAIDCDDTSVIPGLKAQGLELTPTRLHETPGNGLHFIYRVPEGVVIGNGVKTVSGIDYRGERGQIVCPGSVHPNGGTYKVANNRPIAVLPNGWLRKLTEKQPAKDVPAKSVSRGGKVSEGTRNETVFKRGCYLRAHNDSQDVIEEKLLKFNQENCEPPLADDEVRVIAKSVATRYTPSEHIQMLKDGSRRMIVLPSDDRLMSDCASELGECLSDMLYVLNGEVVTLNDGKTSVVSPQLFRTLAEKRVVCCRQRVSMKVTVEVAVTMTVEEARGILASSQFKEKLRQLDRIGTCRLPVMREDGHIELLPVGYDEKTKTVTLPGVDYQEDMSFDEGVAVIRDLFSEFEFNDGDRSLAVAVTALVGLYSALLPAPKSLRPVFTVTKNAPGAGASILMACTIVPVLGSMPAGVKPEDDAEMRKTITATLRSGKTVLVIDNVRGHLDLPSLEAFITSPEWSDRMLGVNETFCATNNVTGFIGGNGLTITSDLRRRMLFIDLHLSVERPEDRVFKRDLDASVLLAMRPKILASCYALVRHWDKLGRPKPSRTHSFPGWDRIIGGIVEAAGFGCPFAPAAVAAVADADGDSIHALADAMQPGRKYTFAEITALCRNVAAFTGLVGSSDFDMTNAHRSRLGIVLGSWNNRLVGSSTFIVDGRGHQKRFWTTMPTKHGGTVEHGLRPVEQNRKNLSLGGRPCSTVPPCSPSSNKSQLVQKKPKGRISTVKTPPSEARPAKFTAEGRKRRIA